MLYFPDKRELGSHGSSCCKWFDDITMAGSYSRDAEKISNLGLA